MVPKEKSIRQLHQEGTLYGEQNGMYSIAWQSAELIKYYFLFKQAFVVLGFIKNPSFSPKRIILVE